LFVVMFPLLFFKVDVRVGHPFNLQISLLWSFSSPDENVLEFSRLFHYSIIKVLCFLLSQTACLLYHAVLFLSTTFFIFLKKFFSKNRSAKPY